MSIWKSSPTRALNELNMSREVNISRWAYNHGFVSSEFVTTNGFINDLLAEKIEYYFNKCDCEEECNEFCDNLLYYINCLFQNKLISNVDQALCTEFVHLTYNRMVRCFEDYDYFDENDENVESANPEVPSIETLKKDLIMSSSRKNTYNDVQIIREGSQIILPEGMSFDEGIRWLQDKKADDEKTVNFVEKFDFYPLEGAIAFFNAIQEKYGHHRITGFWGDSPTYINFKTETNEKTQIPWGKVEIPGIEGTLNTDITFANGRYVFQVVGNIKNKNKAEVVQLMTLVNKFAKEKSIYKGKSIKIRFTKPNERFNINDVPIYLNVSHLKSEDLMLNEDVFKQVRDNIFTLVAKTELCRKFQIPLKRGILLEGDFGTGKTLTAYLTAKLCVENGWTYIYLDSVSQLKTAIEFAKNYQPAVIFGEDIDQVLESAGTDKARSEIANEILNNIDGVDSKSNEIMVILTTNKVDLIEKAMLRPGRLDAVISYKKPDAKTVEKLLRSYSGGLIPETTNISKVSEALAGNIPAVIREVVERAKLSAIWRMNSQEDTLELNDTDLTIASDGMLHQIALLSQKDKNNSSLEVVFMKLVEGLNYAFVDNKFSNHISEVD